MKPTAGTGRGGEGTSERFGEIRAAVLRNPRKMTLQLARELRVPEVEVLRAFPEDRATELDVSRWEELIRGLEPLGTVRVLVSSPGATLEVEGSFGGFSTTGEYFNVQTATLDMHIRWPELAAAFAVEKPGHMDGVSTLSFQFFDRSGAAAFKAFLNFGRRASAETVQHFMSLREKYRKGGGETTPSCGDQSSTPTDGRGRGS